LKDTFVKMFFVVKDIRGDAHVLVGIEQRIAALGLLLRRPQIKCKFPTKWADFTIEKLCIF